MSEKTSQPHIFIFPFMGHSHVFPAIDMAKLFASRGCKTSVILTTGNAPTFAKTIERSRNLGLEIEIVLIRFPGTEVGLPEGCETVGMVTTQEMMKKFFAAAFMLQKPLEQLLKEYRPDCLVAAGFFYWAADVAAKFGIPSLVFNWTGFFASCVSTCLMEYKPHEKVLLDSEPFLVPNLPQEIQFVRDQIPSYMKEESEWTSFVKKVQDSELTSYGVIVNSFYELESEYADHYRRFLGRKAWHIGPLCLCNKESEGKGHRELGFSISEHECLSWLDSKEPNSVVYVSFGTIANFSDAQLREIAAGLEASGKQFIWVVKKEKQEKGVREDWLPEGFEERMEGKTLIIRGLAPQVTILGHQAIGGFVTHCGWNSVSEGVCAGLPMATWPVSSEQFYNEKLVTEIHGIGISVGAKKWFRFEGDCVKSEAVEKAVRRIMEGEEAESMRNKAKKLAEMATRAFEQGGSSYSDLDSLIQELRLFKST